MQYLEILPEDIFSHHIESYWQTSVLPGSEASPFGVFLPTCTFNMIFTDQPCSIKMKLDTNWTHLQSGAYFLGQTNSNVYIKVKEPLKIYGVRFKPHAFSKMIHTAAVLLNNELTPLDNLFELSKTASFLIQQVLSSKETNRTFELINDLMHLLLKKSMSIDETIRAQLNYIMNRRGSVKIYELLDKFKVSKVTLRKHFLNKVGLTPKKVSQIWRMNYMLQMKEDHPEENLTSLCLNAGFYDQAHFIKDFNLLFGVPPRKFFIQNPHLVKLAYQNISRRFTNQYDPRVE